MPMSPVDDAYVATVDAHSIPRTGPAPFEQWTNLHFPDFVSARAIELPGRTARGRASRRR
jgi:hypothetical protein